MTRFDFEMSRGSFAAGINPPGHWPQLPSHGQPSFALQPPIQSKQGQCRLEQGKLRSQCSAHKRGAAAHSDLDPGPSLPLAGTYLPTYLDTSFPVATLDKPTTILLFSIL
ncbi:uncharacterized protein TrAFT101_004534 [Trichoderma asperellum]|uniref:uncharacterized protein n=1 Tax=Trichoderma asperellum TaxID=101201 RepID=UPI00332C0705|nr:hypothetical protein TrAFT101_004534 [Trichoderma asperellum]